MQHQAAKQKEKVRIIQGKLQKHSYKEPTHHKNKNCNTPIIHKNDKEKKNRTNKKRQKLRTPRTQKTKNQHPARSTAAANILQRPRGRTLEEWTERKGRRTQHERNSNATIHPPRGPKPPDIPSSGKTEQNIYNYKSWTRHQNEARKKKRGNRTRAILILILTKKGKERRQRKEKGLAKRGKRKRERRKENGKK